jgi:polysaccharide export outer membrane protein
MRKYITIAFLLISFLHSLSFAQIKDEDEYRICINDLLEISVYEERDLDKTVRVDANGAITYPLIGSLEVKGLTSKELESKITELLSRDYLINPQVSVFIKEYAKISILGQVSRPGAYELKSGLTVIDAVALGGGFTEKANVNSVKLVRIKGKDKLTIDIDVNEIVSKGHKEKDITLEPGDLIIVGELSESASFVVVLGQVKTPGRYSFKSGMTAIEAIALAGGLTEIAAANGTRITRFKDGKKYSIRVPVASILSGSSKARDVSLYPEDTIVVPESFF